ncbi:MAG: hypothetical protein AVDCRST_MAG01-01-1654, partial [uncultured Rubrobacteraceae bacterium]
EGLDGRSDRQQRRPDPPGGEE